MGTSEIGENFPSKFPQKVPNKRDNPYPVPCGILGEMYRNGWASRAGFLTGLVLWEYISHPPGH